MFANRTLKSLLTALAIGAAAAPAMAVPLVVNPSFELDAFGTFPGYINGALNGPITGWTASHVETIGLNPAGSSPFANNGATPDGSQVAFLQTPATPGFGTLSQDVSGFEIGKQYVLTYSENARHNNLVIASAAIDGLAIVDPHLVRPASAAGSFTAPYRAVRSEAFTATAQTMTLAFTNLSAVSTDRTLLLDNVGFLEVDYHLLFSDNFNAVANSNTINPGANDQPDRQFAATGLPVTYTERAHSDTGASPNFSQLENVGFPGALLLAANGSNPASTTGGLTTVSPDINFNEIRPDGDRFIVEVEINPLNGANAGSWAGIMAGVTNQLTSVNGVPGGGPIDGFGLLIRGNGGIQIFDSTTGSAVGLLGAEIDLASLGIAEAGFYDVRLEYFVTAFDNASSVFVEVFVDNILIHSFNTAGGLADNHITLIGTSDTGGLLTHGFDNLRVSSTFTPPIPEPASATLGLMALASLTLRGRRSRNA